MKSNNYNFEFVSPSTEPTKKSHLPGFLFFISLVSKAQLDYFEDNLCFCIDFCLFSAV
jgi:hypothetical protein